MSSLSAHSRRALVATAATAALATAPVTKGKKKGKGKGKKKPPAPLVFTTVRVTNLNSIGFSTLELQVQVMYIYPDGPAVNSFAMPLEVSPTNVESGVIAGVREEVRSLLPDYDIPAKRIAVTIL